MYKGKTKVMRIAEFMYPRFFSCHFHNNRSSDFDSISVDPIFQRFGSYPRYQHFIDRGFAANKEATEPRVPSE